MIGPRGNAVVASGSCRVLPLKNRSMTGFVMTPSAKYRPTTSVGSWLGKQSRTVRPSDFVQGYLYIITSLLAVEQIRPLLLALIRKFDPAQIKLPLGCACPGDVPIIVEN